MIWWIIAIFGAFWLGVFIMACFAYGAYKRGFEDGLKTRTILERN